MRNRSTVNPIYSIRQILEKKWEFNNEVCQLFIHFEKAFDSIKRESLYNILIKIGVPRKLVKIIKICLDDTHNKVRIGNYLSYSFPFENSLKWRDDLLPNQFCTRICYYYIGN
jgi:Reverse transcriptase (RNA-dependent DNA polymerase).